MNNRSLLHFFFSVIIIIIVSCNSTNKDSSERIPSKKEPTIVDLTNVKKINSPINLSEFAESISYIRLDEEPLLGEMRSATLYVVEDTIYVVRENIYKYTPEGRFIKKLFREGQGPEEAKKHVPTPAAINRTGRYFTFSNAVGYNYKSYSFDGRYMGSEAIMDSLEKRINIYFDNCQVFEYVSSRNTYFNIGEKMNIIGSNVFYAKDLNTDEIKFKFPNPAADELATYTRQMEWFGGNMHFNQIDSLLWFKHPAIDTLYYTKDFKTVDPGYIFKTDNSFMNMKQYIHFRVGDITKDEATNLIVISEAIPLPSHNLLFFLGNGRIGFADLNGQTSIYNEKPMINDLDAHIPEINHFDIFYAQQFSIENGYLYFIMDAYKFFEEGSSPPFQSFTEDSNPVVVKLKLK